jgi:hypothetical protein
MRTIEPKSFLQGETLEWTRDFADFPASGGWTLTYYFRGEGKGFDAVGVADGDAFVMTVPSATTLDMSVTDYSWQAIAVKDGKKFLADSGFSEVKKGFADSLPATSLDVRSENEKTLAAIRAMIAGKATHDQQEYTIGNRQLKRIPIPDLIMLENRYEQKVRREKEAARLKKGGKMFQQVLVRMK